MEWESGDIRDYSFIHLSILSQQFQSSLSRSSPSTVIFQPTTTLSKMSDVTPRKEKKEKKDKKRKSEAADITPIAPEAGSASAEAVVAEVDGDKALKKQKKEKRKSLAADGAEDEGKVSLFTASLFFSLSNSLNSTSRQMPSRPSLPLLHPKSSKRSSSEQSRNHQRTDN